MPTDSTSPRPSKNSHGAPKPYSLRLSPLRHETRQTGPKSSAADETHGEYASANERAMPKRPPGLRFHGIFGFLEQQPRDSNSDGYREWLTRYMSAAPAPSAAAEAAPGELAVRLAASPSPISPPCRSLRRGPRWIASARAYAAPARHRRPRPGECRAPRFSPRRRPRLPQPRPLRRHAFRREAQRIRLATQIGSRFAASCTFSTSPPSACTRATTTGCSLRSSNCAISATPSWSSSTTKRPSAAPISSSTLVPARATPAVSGRHRARPTKSPPTRSLTGRYLTGARFPFPPRRRAPTARPSRCWLRSQQSEEYRRRFPWACSPSSPASPAPENPRSSTTSSIAPWRRSFTARMEQPGSFAPSRAAKYRQSHRDRSGPDWPLAALESRHLHRRLCAHPRLFAMLPESRDAATSPAASASTSRAAAAKLARATVCGASR